MIRELEHRIRERAHKIWESEGRPSDRADIHWTMASAELAAQPAQPAAKPRALKAAAAAAPKAREGRKGPQGGPEAQDRRKV